MVHPTTRKATANLRQQAQVHHRETKVESGKGSLEDKEQRRTLEVTQMPTNRARNHGADTTGEGGAVDAGIHVSHRPATLHREGGHSPGNAWRQASVTYH